MNQPWIQEQVQSSHHKIAIYLFPIVIFLGYVHPIIFGIGLFLFFLITSFKLLKSMLLWMLILGVISLLIPFLAPVIFIIMIVLFIMRIGYVIKNWRPFVSGIFLYGISGALIGRSAYLYSYGFNSFFEGAIVSIISFFAIRQLLLWLYQHNYSSYAALGTMGSVPVIIISFILPFLKLHVGGDFFVTDTTVETKPTSGTVYGDTYTDTKVTTGEPVASRSPLLTEQTLVYVNDHVRTAPDGDIRNNLSYHGPDKTVPNSDLVYVKDHVRTSPDGNVMNNLSYQGSDKTMFFNDLDEEASQSKTYYDHVDEYTYDKDLEVNYEDSNKTNEHSAPHNLVDYAQSSIPAQVAVDQLIRKLKDEEK